MASSCLENPCSTQYFKHSRRHFHLWEIPVQHNILNILYEAEPMVKTDIVVKIDVVETDEEFDYSSDCSSEPKVYCYGDPRRHIR